MGRGKVCHNEWSNYGEFVRALGRLSLLLMWAVVGTTVLGLSMLLTSPLVIGPVGVTIWFVVFLLTLATDLALLLYVVKGFLHIHDSPVSRLRYSWRQGLLLSFGLTGLLALSSLQQFSIRDAILLGLLLLIAEIYVRFRWP